MEPAEVQIKLDQLPVGSRLVVRSKANWRFAAVAKRSDERIVLTVCSPSGRNYPLWRNTDSEIFIEGTVPVLVNDEPDDWRENLGKYDRRW
jgi:hypothetical protein